MHLHFTPRQIVEKLDQYIIGQKDAKKAVAVALRNRYRRSKLAENLRDEIAPKNILMIGPTGVGKTEVARRMAKLVGAPFIKVEATKFTEVGYVGRDVESMVRDLVETSVRIVKEEMVVKVQDKAEEQANQRLVEILVPSPEKQSGFKNPLEMLLEALKIRIKRLIHKKMLKSKRNVKMWRESLLAGLLEEEIVSIEVTEQQSSMFDMLQGTGMEQMGMNFQDALGSFMPKKRKT